MRKYSEVWVPLAVRFTAFPFTPYVIDLGWVLGQGLPRPFQQWKGIQRGKPLCVSSIRVEAHRWAPIHSSKRVHTWHARDTSQTSTHARTHTNTQRHSQAVLWGGAEVPACHNLGHPTQQDWPECLNTHCLEIILRSFLAKSLSKMWKTKEKWTRGQLLKAWLREGFWEG